MKDKIPIHLNTFRVYMPGYHPPLGDDRNGAFEIPYKGRRFRLIVSDGGGWDHVSISLKDRCPTWLEMCHFKDLFFKKSETVVQFHPAEAAYVNLHPNCLHLWRKQKKGGHELPPFWMIGPLKSIKTF